MVQNELEQLRLVKCELENDRGHKYGLWSKSVNDDNTFNYQRICKKCGFVENFSTFVIQSNIERVIESQQIAKERSTFFCNSSNDNWNNENILAFLAGNIDYFPYMDIDKIIDKIIDVNGGYSVHNNEEENLIFNSVLWLKKSGDIPSELFNSIYKYLEKKAKEYLNMVNSNKDSETKIIEFPSSHSSRRTA